VQAAKKINGSNAISIPKIRADCDRVVCLNTQFNVKYGPIMFYGFYSDGTTTMRFRHALCAQRKTY